MLKCSSYTRSVRSQYLHYISMWCNCAATHQRAACAPVVGNRHVSTSDAMRFYTLALRNAAARPIRHQEYNIMFLWLWWHGTGVLAHRSRSIHFRFTYIRVRHTLHALFLWQINCVCFYYIYTKIVSFRRWTRYLLLHLMAC